MVQQPNTAKKSETETKAPEGQMVTPPAAPSSTGQAAALRTDTKINTRSQAAFGKVDVATVRGGKLEIKGMALAPEGSVRSSAKGVMFASPGAYLVALGNVEPSPRAPQAQLAVKVAKELGATKEVGVDLHHLQHEYVKNGGTDLSIFTGKTRLYTNGGKCAQQMVDGKKTEVAPLTIFLTPAPKAEAVAAAVEKVETKEIATEAKK